jgi:hypothetical protein
METTKIRVLMVTFWILTGLAVVIALGQLAASLLA